MISKHTIRDYSVDGSLYGAVVLAHGRKGVSQKIFMVLELLGFEDDPAWFFGKYVILRGSSKDPKGLLSDEVEHIGNCKPEEVREKFPEYFL